MSEENPYENYELIEEYCRQCCEECPPDGMCPGCECEYFCEDEDENYEYEFEDEVVGGFHD